MDSREYLQSNDFITRHAPRLSKKRRQDESTRHDRVENALKYAHDIRKFEIDLYWKRATYFWALIATCIGGFILVFNSDSSKLDELAKVFKPVVLQLLSSLACIFSLAWFFVNKGSKFWQRNWEFHVDLLEDEISGPLYKVVHSKDGDSLWKPHYAYPYSVSSINQWLSAVVTFVAVGICVAILPWGSPTLSLFEESVISWPQTCQILIFSMTLLFSYWMGDYGRIKSHKDKKWNVKAVFTRRSISTDLKE